MTDQTPAAGRAEVIEHFAARAATYDASSSWCTDDSLGEMTVRAAAAGPADHVLDVACGTGLVSRLFHGRVARVVGVDITAQMADQALAHLDELVITPAEHLPFAADSFDVVVSRQGIQFMQLPAAVDEMVRVLRPGGRIVLINLCAYGEQDKEEYFEILRLRNPVRRHFFLREDLERLLREAGCRDVRLETLISVEDVDVWSDNGAIEDDRREAIQDAYRNASPGFSEVHGVRVDDGRILDRMLFGVAVGLKP
jgi:SAM-dependent methyltransferase